MVVSGIVLLIAWRPWSRSGAPIDGRWGGPLALGAGFCAIVPTIIGRMPKLWPSISPDCIFYVAILMTVVGLLDVLVRPPFLVRTVIVTVALTVGMVAVVRSQLL